MPATALLWFRRDLRLADNPALARALEVCERVVPVYIHAPEEEAPWQPGAASRWWLHHSLAALDSALRGLGSGLVIAAGESLAELQRFAGLTGATHCFWNRLYDPAPVARDTRIKQALRADGLWCESFTAGLLFEPWDLATGNRGPYRVFTPFWRRCQPELPAMEAPAAPPALPPLPGRLDGLSLQTLGLLPSIRWDEGLAAAWQPGEAPALAKAEAFLRTEAADYPERRDRPEETGTSILSPHLHFGEIGPRQLVSIARQAGGSKGFDAFLRALGWREFAHHLLYHFPHTQEAPLDDRFAGFPWRKEGTEALLEAWQQGRTGIPLVDAGMRELWKTGWMHNRVRMVAASLLTKNLRIPWQLGARWFWDTLVDADLANNTLGWQWTAGCGADAAPYFRVFNPVRQGERFDPDGAYVRRWCPELDALPNTHIHQPWGAPADILTASRLSLGRDYPLPIVDLAESRRQALAAWESIRGGASGANSRLSLED
jgi:deoxyribodipyrimidine photo-lyase